MQMFCLLCQLVCHLLQIQLSAEKANKRFKLKHSDVRSGLLVLNGAKTRPVSFETVAMRIHVHHHMMSMPMLSLPCRELSECDVCPASTA